MRIHLLRRPRAAALAASFVVAGGSLAVAARGPANAIPDHPDRATIVHVLDRIGFGPAPGQVDRVQAMGLAAYIDQQLHPERIATPELDARLANFATLTMKSDELADTYFLPAQRLRRQQQAQSNAAANARRRAAGNPSMADAPDQAGGDQPGADQTGMMSPAPSAPARANAAPSPAQREARLAAQTVITELTQAKMLRAALSDRQLEEVLTDFWFNHFNVSLTKGAVRQYVTEYEREAIRPHVLGRFRDLLGAVAHSPAMLFYLDNWQSAGPNTAVLPPQLQQRLADPRLRPEQRQRLLDQFRMRSQRANRPARGLNENYAREIMELHTLGVDGGYTQKDVTELARILTGWTIDRPQQGGRFVFRPGMHDQGTKTFLGTQFLPDGEFEGERALDMLAAHPSTAHHIAYELAQRFVADEPPAALVDRAAQRFTETKGDLREVVRTIITSPEFFSDDVRHAKVKTPFEFIVSSVRATGAVIVNAQPLVAAMRNMGMPLYSCEPPTGYSMTADAWVNTGSLLNRMNFAVQLVSGEPIRPDNPARGAAAPARPNAARGPLAGRGRQLGRAPVRIDLAALAPDAGDTAREQVIDVLLNGDASAATRETLARATDPQTLVALALGSPEFQRR